jgi:glycosyltransferase involved in cell wall biosynthesis
VKIVHVVNSLGCGGAENLVLDLAKEMQGQGHELMIISLTDRIEYSEKIDRYQLKVETCGFSGTIYHLVALFKAYRRFKSLLKTFMPDVGHSHIFLSDLFLRFAADSVTRLITTFHGNEPWWSCDTCKKWLKSMLEGWSARRYGDVFISVSEQAKQEAAHTLGLRVDDISVVLNGVDATVFRPTARKSEFPIIIQVARFYPEKCHADCVKAFSKVHASKANAQLWLVGEGPLRNALEEQVAQQRLGSVVKFLGLRQDVPQLLAQASIFVLSSEREGLPISLLEAMASGVPVVATAVGEIPKIIKDGSNGFLVKPRDPDELAEKMIEVLNDPQATMQRVSAARSLVEEKLSIKATTAAYMVHYQKVLGH